jgi:hypothetical protein
MMRPAVIGARHPNLAAARPASGEEIIGIAAIGSMASPVPSASRPRTRWKYSGTMNSSP